MVSTVDTVGIPLMLLAQARIVRPPFVYAAIGLPERLAQLRTARMERLYARALGSAAAIVAYSRYEADVIDGWLRERGVEAPVEFVPFGVDVDAFRPRRPLPTSTSSRSVPIRTATSSCCSTSPARCPTRASSW